MKKKEWREVSKQSLFFVVFLAGIALLIGGIDLIRGVPFEGEKFIIMLGLWLLTGSLFLGLSPFALDSKQQGLEYLLTLPVSRRRLLLIKLLPRLAAAAFFYGVFFSLYHVLGHDAFGGYFEFFSLVYISLFFISFSLSSVHENFIVQSIWAGLALGGFLILCSLIMTQGFAWSNNLSLASIWRFGHFGNLIYDPASLVAAIVVFLLLLAPFMASYFLAFIKYDLRPARNFNRRQLLFFVPLLLLALGTSLGVSYQLQKSSMLEDSDFYLTESGQLLKTSWPGKLTVYDENGRKKIDTNGALYWNRVLLEKGQQLFLLGYDREADSSIIIRLNMEDFSCKTLYQVPERCMVGNSYYSIGYDGENFVTLQRNRTEADRPGMNSRLPLKSDVLELIRVDPFSGQSRTVTYLSPIFKKFYDPRIFGCDQINGLRFWLIANNRSILRLWEDGRVEDLGLSKGFPAFCGNTLFTIGDNSLQVRKLLENDGGSIKKIAGEFSLGLHSRFFQENIGINEIYAKRGKLRSKRIVRIDLTTLAVDDVGPDRGLIFLVPPGDFYYIEHANWPDGAANRDMWRRIYRLQGGKMVFLRQFNLSEPGQGHVWLEKFGVILREKSRNRIFAFPDLRELKYKNLN